MFLKSRMFEMCSEQKEDYDSELELTRNTVL